MSSDFTSSYLVHPGTPTLENRVSIPDQPGVTTGSAEADYAAWFLGLGPEYSGDKIDHETALTYSAVWACVKVISESLAGVGWHVYERSEDGRTRLEIEDDIAWMLGMQSNPEMTAFEFRQVMLKNALTWGNGYAEIERTQGGKPSWLWPIHPSRVCPVRDEAKRLWYEVKNGPGITSTYLNPADVFHLRGLGPDGIVGYSVVEMARRTIKLGLQEERFGSDFFARGPMPGGIVTVPGKMNSEQRREFRRGFEDVYTGSRNSHRIVVLSDGVAFDPATLPNDDAQFLESRAYQITEVCRWYRVPPHKIADLTRSTFSNIEDQNREFASDCLMPWSSRLESEANVKLYGRTSRGRRFTRIDMEELQRGNSQQQTDNVTRRVAGGIITPNEGRKSLDLDPLDGGDVLLVQGAMTTLERVVEPPELPEPPAMPEEPPGAEPPAAAAPKVDVAAARRVLGTLLADVYRQVYRVDGDKAKRAANKGDAALARRIDEYDDPATVSQVQAMLSPAFAAAVLALGGGEEAGWAVAGLAAERHVNRCRADLKTYGVRALIAWESRPAEVAAAEIAMLIRAYSEDQERDEAGRFGSGGGGGSEEANSTTQDARDAHDEKVQQERDTHDEAKDAKREAEDKAAEKDSEKIDKDREHEDAQRDKESEKIDQQREAEDKTTETKRESEDKTAAEAEKATDADRQKVDDERDAKREAEDKAIEDKAEREEITDAERLAEHAANDRTRAREDKATDAQREKEDAQREREAERTDKSREKEDATRDAKREKEDAKREAEQEKIDQKREAEDKARERHEAAVEKQRKEEDAATERQREREDKAKEKARQEEDAGAKNLARPFAYSEDQERDEKGRFGSGGGGGKEDAAPKDPGARPARPEKGFKDDKAIADHAAKMVEAHEADPHVQSMRAAHEEASGMVAAAQEKIANAKSGADAQAAYKEYDAARGQKQRAENALQHEARRSFLLSFGVPHDQQPSFTVKGDFSKYNAAERENTFDAARSFVKNISTKEAVGDQQVFTTHAASGRACYHPGIKTIELSKGDKPEIAAHEFGHHLEETKAIGERVRAFSKERFGKEKPTDMAKVSPQYGYKKGEEFGRKDDMEKLFGDKNEAYYCGKQYEGGRTEVMAMGVQQLYRDPIHFAKTDPGYFKTVTGALQGGKK